MQNRFFFFFSLLDYGPNIFFTTFCRSWLKWCCDQVWLVIEMMFRYIIKMIFKWRKTAIYYIYIYIWQSRNWEVVMAQQIGCYCGLCGTLQWKEFARESGFEVTDHCAFGIWKTPIEYNGSSLISWLGDLST